MTYLGRLDPLVMRRLATLLGVPSDARGDRLMAATVLAGKSKPAVFAALKTLPADGRNLLLSTLALVPGRSDAELNEFCREGQGWTKARDREACEALLSSGLVQRSLPDGRPSWIFPPVREALVTDMIAWSATATADALPVVSFAHRLALLAAFFYADPPRVTQARTLNAHWLERVYERFATLGTSRGVLGATVRFFQQTDAIVWKGAVDGAHRVSEEGLAVLALPPEDLALAFLEIGGNVGQGSTTAALAALEYARRSGPGPIPLDALVELGKHLLRPGGWKTSPFEADDFEHVPLAAALGRLRTLGLATVGLDEGQVVVWRTSPPPAPPTPRPKWIVQPNFDVLVPEDADPVATARLGALADLVVADRVARFTLTKESVARAATFPGGAAAAVERLAAGAEHGLPENVAATLRDWARRATPLRAFTGAVVIAGNEEQAAFLRSRGEGVREIAPGVFHGRTTDLDDLLRAAGKAGHLSTPVESDTEDYSERWRQRPDPVNEAAALRRRIEENSKPPVAPKAPPKPRPVERPASIPPRIVPPAPVGRGPVVRTVEDLEDNWPEIADAVRGDDRLLRVALELDENDLECIADQWKPKRIRAVLSVMADARAAGIGRWSSTGPPPPPEPPRRVEAPSEESESPWTTPAPGHLHTFLEAAILRGARIDVLYVNSEGKRSEHSVAPQRLVRDGPAEWLVALNHASSGICRYHLDRIAAVRAPAN